MSDSSTLIAAAEALERLAVQYQGFVSAAKDIKEFVSADAGLTGTQKALAEATKELQSTQAQVKDAKKGYDAFIEKANAEKSAILAKAEADAKTLRDDAVAYSRDIVEKATAAVEAAKASAKAESDTELLKKSAELAALRSDVNGTNNKRIHLSIEFDALSDRIQALKQQEAEIKDRLRKIVGD